MIDGSPIPHDLPELTVENYTKIKELIIENTNNNNDRGYYDHYMRALIASKDCNILEYFISYFALVDNTETQQIWDLRQDFVHNINIFNMTIQDTALMSIWVLCFKTFQDKAMEYLQILPVQDSFQYLDHNTLNKKIITIINAKPYDDNYRHKYYELIMASIRNSVYESTKDIREAILRHNLMDDFMSTINSLPLASMNTAKFFEGLDVPAEYKLGVIL